MHWLGRLLRRKALERELDQELAFHLEQHVRDLMAAGLDAGEARRRANLELGGVQQVKEAARDARGTRWLEDWWQDTRFAFRAMRRSSGFTAAAVLTLAIGIGANTAVFGLVNALLLRPLPVDRPEQLTVLKRVGLDDRSFRFSSPLFHGLRATLTDSTRLAGMSSAIPMYTVSAERPEPITVQLVTGDWFRLLGVGAAVGRPLEPVDDGTLGGHPVAVLSDGYWTRRFGRNPAVIGTTIRINGTPLTVVGIAEPGFFGVIVGESIDAWVPTAMQHEIRYQNNASVNNADITKPWAPQAGIEWLTLIHRLPARGGVIESESRLNRRFRAEIMELMAGRDSVRRAYRLRESIALASMARGLSPIRDRFAEPLLALMVSVGLVLLIACANLAGLLLARSAARSHEIAVRVSLGAKAGRLIRQVLTESVTLAFLGGALSLVVARVGGLALLHAASGGPTGIPLDVSLDGPMLAFAFLVSLATGILFGLAPAVRVARGDLYQTFKTGGRVIGGGARRLPLGRALVVSQIALSLVLVTAAGLFIRTLRNLLAVDPGFEREQVIGVRFDSRAAGYTADQVPALHQRLADAVAAVPSVRSSSLSLYRIASGSARTSSFQVPGQNRGPEWDSSLQEDYVTPQFFTTVGIPILRGRGFTPADGPGQPKVAIIGESAARHFFGDVDPIGKRIGYDEDANLEIVGVARDARINNVRQDPPRMIYLPAAQMPDEFLTGIEARVGGPASRAIPALRPAIAAVDRNLPVRDVTTLGDLVSRGLASERFASELVGVFGGLALALAAIGLYGIMAYSVARRTNEIGIRLALGAAQREVRWLILRDTLGLVLLGLTIGTVLLIPSLGLVRGLVYGFSPRDPATVAIAGAILLATGVMAGTVPAWRAARVDPAIALRAE